MNLFGTARSPAPQRKRLDAVIEGAATSLQYRLLVLFIAMIPFAYPLQVLTGSPLVASVTYIPTLGLIVLGFRSLVELRRTISSERIVFACLLFFASHNFISGIISIGFGDLRIGGRVLVLFVLPFVIAPYAAVLSEEQRLSIIKVIGISAFIISLELIWEEICTTILHRASWFQLRNAAYVLHEVGKDLTQLYDPNYRPTGLLEHGHVTSFFVGLGLVANICIFTLTTRYIYLIIGLICEFALINQGFRLPMISAGFSLFIFYSFTLNQSESTKRSGFVTIPSVVSVIIVSYIFDVFGAMKQYIVPAALHGDFQTGNSNAAEFVGGAAEPLIHTLVARFTSVGTDIYLGLFGHGIAASLRGDTPGLSDDLFVGQLILQYGLFGSVIGGVLIVAKTKQYFIRWKKSKGEESALLVFGFATVILFCLSTLHSGVVQRKETFPLLILFLAG